MNSRARIAPGTMQLIRKYLTAVGPSAASGEATQKTDSVRAFNSCPLKAGIPFQSIRVHILTRIPSLKS